MPEESLLKICPEFKAPEKFLSTRLFCSDALVLAFMTYLTIAHLNIVFM